jgi:hypothetical protein
MKVPQSYLLVYPKFNKMLHIIDVDAYEKDIVNAEFYGLKKCLSLAFEKCSKDYEYCDNWLKWLNNKDSTLLLRELFNKVGCNYWENIYNGNVIDKLDSLQCEIFNN